MCGDRWGESKDLKITSNCLDQKVLRASKETEGQGHSSAFGPLASCDVSVPGTEHPSQASVSLWGGQAQGSPGSKHGVSKKLWVLVGQRRRKHTGFVEVMTFDRSLRKGRHNPWRTGPPGTSCLSDWQFCVIPFLKIPSPPTVPGLEH